MTLSAEQVLDGVPRLAVLTMDFFDTMVTRSVAQPTHVFAVMEHDLIAENGIHWRGFAAQRVQAEHAARRVAAADDELRDVTIGEIYEQLATLRPISHRDRTALIERERRTEISLVRPVKFGREVVALARLRGHRVLIVSDNYMPAEHIAEMAQAAGYEWVTPDDVIVSCEHGGMKHNGGLWRTVLAALQVEPATVLHIGDDHNADGVIPQSFGLHTFIRENMRRSHRVMENTTPDVLPLSRIEADLRDEYCDQDWPVAAVVGAGAAALLISAQIVDVMNVLREREIAGVHFVARDGYLAHEVWNRLRDQGVDLPPATYTALSRSVIWRARLTDINEKSVHRFIGDDETISPVRLERRVGCALTGTNSPNTQLNADEARQLLLHNAQSIEGASTVLRTNMLAYLEAQGALSPGHHLFVDLGWTGSTIADLNWLIADATHGETTIEGRLLGAYWDIAPHRVRVPLNGFAVDEFDGVESNVRLLGCQSMFESILTAPHGSVVNYDATDSGVQPVCAETPAEIDAYESYGRTIGEYAIDSAVKILLGTHTSGVTKHDITSDVAWATMMQIGHSPRVDEAQLLSSVHHVTAIDHEGDGDSLVASLPTPHMNASELDAIYNRLIHHHWVQGTLVSWQSNRDVRWVSDEIRRIWPMFQPQWVQIP